VRHGPADAPVALTGYAGGLWRKRELLTLEGVLPPGFEALDPQMRSAVTIGQPSR
jgi:hypothetical protein